LTEMVEATSPPFCLKYIGHAAQIVGSVRRRLGRPLL
jgi:hypothetical protein